jgi:hypothetical protein
MQPIPRETTVLCPIAKAAKRPNKSLNLAILGIETIRDLIIEIVEEMTTILDLQPAEMTAGTLNVPTVKTDIQTAETDVRKAGTDAMIAGTDIAAVEMTEILETTL